MMNEKKAELTYEIICEAINGNEDEDIYMSLKLKLHELILGYEIA